MRKIIPSLYIVIGLIIITTSLYELFQEKSSYRVLFNFTTEHKVLFLLVRGLFASWFLFDGIKKWKSIYQEH